MGNGAHLRPLAKKLTRAKLNLAWVLLCTIAGAFPGIKGTLYTLYTLKGLIKRH